MTNPFDGIITTQMKTTFNNMIDEVLRALSVPCSIIYGNTKHTQCPNCKLDPITRRSANRYRDGGPSEFVDGQICPYCSGVGFLAEEAQEDDISLAVIRDRKKFINLDPSVKLSDGTIQTLCAISLLPKLKKAKELEINTDLSNYAHYRYIRDSEPLPLGFGSEDYIITYWKKAS